MKKLALVMLLVLLGPFTIIPSFADNSYFNSTLSDLSGFSKNKKSISVFFPFFFIIAVTLFMIYGLKNRDDKTASIFMIASAVLCIVLSLMFVSPLEFTSTTNVSQITVEQNQLVDSIVNSTSVIKTTNELVIIPNDKQFRFILSSFFDVFALLNGLLTIMIVTRWSKETK